MINSVQLFLSQEQSCDTSSFFFIVNLLAESVKLMCYIQLKYL